jgi:hypothetical protein
MPKEKLIVSDAQREALKKIKTLLGEKGFGICEVAEKFRRDPYDFLAYQKDWPSSFFVVRPTPKGWVSITPSIPPLLERLQDDPGSYLKGASATVLWVGRSLRHLSRHPTWWPHYFPPGVLPGEEQNRRG